MEEWQLEFEWLRIRKELRQKMGMDKEPDLNAVLLLIGIQELGFSPSIPFEKEVKQDLMHIAVCRLLSDLGMYTYEGPDEEGWPHYRKTGKITASGEKEQEKLLIECVVNYFKQIEFI
jgi:hypothetical protein